MRFKNLLTVFLVIFLLYALFPSMFLYAKGLVGLIKKAVLGKCGIENCHGLDISCGPNIPDACTAIYYPGDGCRKFASCELVDGDCVLVTDQEFDLCEACVENCEQLYKENQSKSFDCQSGCVVIK